MADSCGNPAVETDALMPKKAKFDRSDQCVRCKASRGHLVVRHTVYCKQCFDGQLQARFRKALELHVNHGPGGPRRGQLKPAGDLLVGFSGGVGASVLLELVHRTYIARKAAGGGSAHPRNENVWRNVRAAYVDVADAFPDAQMRDRTEEMRDAVSKYDGIQFVALRLQDAFDPEWWTRVSGKPAADMLVDLSTEELPVIPSTDSSKPLASLRAYLAALPTPTAVQSAVSSLVRVLLLHTAAATRSSHLVLGTSLTSLSISLISTIAQGGGFAVPQVTHEEWVPNFRGAAPASGSKAWAGEVRVLRPLREVGMKECAAWAHWHGVRVPGKSSLPASQTIGGLTKAFVVGLEKDYPSTVSTIAKTTAKLAPKGASDARCALCELPVQHGVHEWRARISIRARPDESAGETRQALAPLLCYACHTMLRSRASRSAAPSKAGAGTPNTVVRLPVWAAAAACARAGSAEPGLGDAGAGEEDGEGEVWEARRMDRTAMRDAVGEFLLDP